MFGRFEQATNTGGDQITFAISGSEVLASIPVADGASGRMDELSRNLDVVIQFQALELFQQCCFGALHREGSFYRDTCHGNSTKRGAKEQVGRAAERHAAHHKSCSEDGGRFPEWTMRISFPVVVELFTRDLNRHFVH